jgi:tetratricopeptide (TPR) repeat protein
MIQETITSCRNTSSVRAMIAASLVLWLSIALYSCSTPAATETSDQPVAVSLSGKQFFEPVRTPVQQAQLDSLVEIARNNFEADPTEENYIWYGRREAYLMHLHEAIAIFTEGLEKYPDSYRLYRHRGHRYISMRKFDLAIDDLRKAEALMQGKPLEIEPDGQPNKLNIPLSTTQFNVWYHLGLAHYLLGNFDEAREAYLKCLAVCENDDSRVAVLDWLYMTDRRSGRNTDAESVLDGITDSMKIVENDSYFRRLKMYKGWLKPEDLLVADSTLDDYDLSMATQGYGVGNWYLYNGDTTRAMETFQKVVDGKLFAAFGFIAAEAELAREVE